MKVAVFSAKSHDRQFLNTENERHGHHLTYIESRLTADTVMLASGHAAVSAFVHDVLDAAVIEQLKRVDVQIVALRCAGYNNVDLKAAKRAGIAVTRVPAYSPHAVAEHTIGLILNLNRKIHRAYGRVRDGNFALDGLLGFDMVGKTVGIVGTGGIGTVVSGILLGFGCRVLAVDPSPSRGLEDLGVKYTSLESLIEQSNIISLHCPLTPETRHIIGERAIARMRPGVMLINTGRGALVDARAVIDGLKSGRIGHLGLDVYEEESGVFYEDLSNRILSDDVLARLLTFPNVLITSHQGFFTQEALTAIARTTLISLSQAERGLDTDPAVTLVSGA